MAENGIHKPRLCKVVKAPDGYGFHLHGEKGKIGQRIRKIEPGSVAEQAGLLVGDKIVCVNGHNVEKDSHQEVVKRIKEKDTETELFVVDEETERILKEKGIPITIDLVANGTESFTQAEDVLKEDAAVPEEQTPIIKETTQTANGNASGEMRPRLCKLEKGASGYGFNLHSEKGKPGRYVRSVDPGTPAEKAGMLAGDRIIEVNGVNMEFEKHAKLVTAVKESGNSVSLLVVDAATDEFFKSCEVTPTNSHVTGPLPTPKPPKKEEEKQDQADILTMDLTMLKEKSRSSKRKKAPTSNWENRRAMFNEL